MSSSSSQAGSAEALPETGFTLPVFDPPVLAAPQPAGIAARSDAIDEGIALHGLLERLTQSGAWPVSVPDAGLIARWLRCPADMAATIREQAQAILAQAELEHFFDPSRHQRAHNELEVMVGTDLFRFDRVVIFEDAVWILDYKRNLLDNERAGYRAQLARYRAAAQSVFGGKQIRSALITVDGRLWEMA